MIRGHPNFTTISSLATVPNYYSTFRDLGRSRMHVFHGGGLFHKYVEWQTTHPHMIFLAIRHKLTTAWIYSKLLQCTCNDFCPYTKDQAKIAIGLVLLSLIYFGFFVAWRFWQSQNFWPPYSANLERMSIRSCNAVSDKLFSSAFEKPQDPFAVFVLVLRIAARHASRLTTGMLISGCCSTKPSIIWSESFHWSSSVWSCIVSRFQYGDQKSCILWFILIGSVIQISCLMSLISFSVRMALKSKWCSHSHKLFSLNIVNPNSIIKLYVMCLINLQTNGTFRSWSYKVAVNLCVEITVW